MKPWNTICDYRRRYCIPTPRIKFISHSHAKYAFTSGHMTPCKRNLESTHEKMILIHGIMHDTMGSIKSTWCLAQHTEMIHIIGFNMSVSLQDPYSALPKRQQNWN